MSASMSTVCVHCHSTIPDETEDFEILLRSRTALTCIFKLDYLTAFDLMKNQDPLESFESWTFCQPCRQLLSRLQHLYKEFMDVGKLESYIVKHLNQLNEIIESHRQKETECDLLCDLEEEEGRFCQNSDEEPSLKKPRITPSSLRSEIQIKLTRLPERDFTLHTSARYDESDVKQEPSDESTQLDQDDEFTDYGNVNSVSSFYNEDNSEDNSTYPEPSQKRRVSKKSGKASRSKRCQDSRPESRKSGNSERVKRPVKISTTIYQMKRTVCPNPCWYCKRRDFPTPADCVEHTKTEHVSKLEDPSIALICDRCAQISYDESQFSNHREKCEKIPSGVLLPKTFSCPECSRLFGRRDCLQKHIQYVHSNDRPFACDLCPYRAKIAKTLQTHTEMMHSTQKFECNECHKIFNNELSFKSHNFFFHTEEGRQKHDERNAKGRIRSKIRWEKTKVPKPKITLCKDCNVDFYSVLALKNHRKTVHNDTQGASYTCETCGQVFAKGKYLTNHRRNVHTNERNHMCEHCGKGFKTKETLRNHVEQTHTEEGRLKYNEKTRERVRRRKLLQQQLAERGVDQ